MTKNQDAVCPVKTYRIRLYVLAAAYLAYRDTGFEEKPVGAVTGKQ
jgi:hypothetical protein